MDLHKRKIIDYEVSLPNTFHEKFCQEYVRLDIEDRVVNKKARRVKAYRFSFPETIGDNKTDVDRRALNLLRRKEIVERIRYIYEQEGTSIEAEYYWTKSKAEGVLVEIAYDDESKDADRINAVKQLNQMRGIDIPKVEDRGDSESSIDKFFKMVGGKVEK